MNDLGKKLAAITILVGGTFIAGCCTSDQKTTTTKKDEATGLTLTSTSERNGAEAGGTEEETFTVSVKVAALDKPTRQLTLVTEDGTKATFIAGPEIRNYDQIAVGDRVTATVKQKLTVFVRADGADPSVTHAAALATAPKGAKPGALVGQGFEVVATVKSIDPEKRIATLQFSDGLTHGVRVRPGVELSRYKVGDTVVIQGTESLSVIVAKP